MKPNLKKQALLSKTRNCWSHSTILLLVLGFSVNLPGKPAFANDEVTFNRDIRPILSDRCFACHGPDAATRESGLRLDVADGEEGAHQSAIKPGSFSESELWRRITSTDADEQMPPPDAHLPKLSSAELKKIKAWIESGADYEKYWAFELPKKSTSSLENANNNPIDQLVLNRLKTKGRTFSEQADARTLIRRVTFDLTGLPPSRSEVHAFVDKYKNGSDKVWENLVDDLLSRNDYGEHMARYWLDLVRFADTNGMHKDFYRNHIAYRDWVIDSFNRSLGYDDFVRYQLAGDLFESPTNEQLIASGFNRLHLIIDKGTALPEESFHKNVVDRVTAVGTGFLGLTVHCAQCHDHKYDPITQKDFYSLYAFFNNIDATPETVRKPPNGLQPPFISLGTDEQHAKLAEFDKQIAELQSEVERIKSLDGTIERSKRFKIQLGDEQKKQLAQLAKDIEKVKKDKSQFDLRVPKAMVMKERAAVRPTFLLERGEYDAPGETVARDTPGFLFSLNKQDETATRMDLANWMVDPQNPLTARVAVNRIWQQFFGVGIVKTSEDIGAQGEMPSHPELLDELAVSFVESGWDVKRLVKQVVMSQTYRQSSKTSSDDFKRDPENRLLARGSRFRLDAEMIRDQILATSGLLSKQMYGRSVKPPQPDGLWKAVTMIGEKFVPDQGDAIYRRSIYTYWKRGMPPPQMTILNAPFRDACVARRERTNTPSQALLLLNEAEYLKAARHLAVATLKQDPPQRLNFIWETVTSRLPDAEESKSILLLIGELKSQYGANPDLAKELCQGMETNGNEETNELAAWTVVGNLLYNLDITKTHE